MRTSTSNQKLLSALFVLIAGFAVFSYGNITQPVYAESNDSEPGILVSEQLRKNPFAMKIIKEMEAQKLRYKQMQEGDFKLLPTAQQLEVEEKRKIAKQILQNDIESMEKRYEDFTPTNAFAKFVSKLNSTHQEIFWDQFDYLKTKVELANAAKNSVLENGGSYFDAQKEYFKYASMSRVEMISYIQELNIRYGFADKNIQLHFDGKGKLPRFGEDDDAPCYGCINVNSQSSQQNELSILQTKLSELRQEFLYEKDMDHKKSLVESMNVLVDQIREITYPDKY